MTDKEYQNAIDWLFVQAPNYQKVGAKAYKPGLNNIKKLCAFFNHPQDKIKTIHVGGTNGKGSTSNMLASILQEAGYKVGLFNSPHLVDFTERIKVNGKNADKEFVYNFIGKLKKLPKDIQPSFFEFTTVMAFTYFLQEEVDVAIIEVGLGGRLDSTNIIQPMVTAITNVALDHQNLLGDTLEEITYEKAGIIKQGVPIVCGSDNKTVVKVIREKALQEKAFFVDVTCLDGDDDSDLKGYYQHQNRRVVKGIINQLSEKGIEVSEKQIKEGLLRVHANTGFYGRWYEVAQNPLIICDTAHNFEGLQSVFNQLNEMPQYKHIILGFVNDKKIDEVLEILPTHASYYFVKPSTVRARDPKDYEEQLKKQKIAYKIFDSVEEGFLFVNQQVEENEIIFIGGSNFVLADFFQKKFVD